MSGNTKLDDNSDMPANVMLRSKANLKNFNKKKKNDPYSRVSAFKLSFPVDFMDTVPLHTSSMSTTTGTKRKRFPPGSVYFGRGGIIAPASTPTASPASPTPPLAPVQDANIQDIISTLQNLVAIEEDLELRRVTAALLHCTTRDEGSSM
jgi:hypothetical protein